MKLTDKIDLSLDTDDIKVINEAQSNSFVHRWLQNIPQMQLKVGDVLVKYTRDFNLVSGTWSSWRVIQVNNRKTPRKYVVVHVDEYGVPYIKSLKINGTPMGKITPITDLSAYNKYEHDPDYADHLILYGEDEEYDPIAYVRKDETS